MALSADAGIGERLADLSARLRSLVQAQAKDKDQADARVRLARPLEAPPAAARVDALLGLERVHVGGAQPQAPYAPSLGAFQDQISACLRCSLGGKRKSLIFGEGDPKAPLVFVGTAPGGDEEAAGRPLVGAAGQLLDRMVAAMGFQRSEVYVCNVLKCRTHGAKLPDPAEVAACRPYLEHQLGLLSPKAVIALGETAASLLLGSAQPLAALRGRWGTFQGLKVMPTYHPYDLLRDAGLKRHVWDDLKLVLKVVKSV
jgi:uracil-DNA glycosylase family 4